MLKKQRAAARQRSVENSADDKRGENSHLYFVSCFLCVVDVDEADREKRTLMSEDAL